MADRDRKPVSEMDPAEMAETVATLRGENDGLRVAAGAVPPPSIAELRERSRAAAKAVRSDTGGKWR